MSTKEALARKAVSFIGFAALWLFGLWLTVKLFENDTFRAYASGGIWTFIAIFWVVALPACWPKKRPTLREDQGDD